MYHTGLLAVNNIIFIIKASQIIALDLSSHSKGSAIEIFWGVPSFGLLFLGIKKSDPGLGCNPNTGKYFYFNPEY